MNQILIECERLDAFEKGGKLTFMAVAKDCVLTVEGDHPDPLDMEVATDIRKGVFENPAYDFNLELSDDQKWAVLDHMQQEFTLTDISPLKADERNILEHKRNNRNTFDMAQHAAIAAEVHLN